MKKFIPFLILLIPILGISQHTFSIVAVDPITGEIGSAGATCISSEDGAIAISDIILGVGAIHTQSYWTLVNQAAARIRMEAGDSPSSIISWLIANDNTSQGGIINDREYGIVDLNGGSPRTAAYTGSSNLNEKGQRLGSNYSIQGNVLISQDVLNDMEAAFLATSGTLSNKLMAVLQAAKRPGADSRCLTSGISSGSSFIRVAKPTDTDSSYGNLWLDLNVWLDSGDFVGDPIDELQKKYDEFNTTLGVENTDYFSIQIYPNPTSDFFELTNIPKNTFSSLKIYSITGNELLTLDTNFEKIDLSNFESGVYFLVLYSSKGVAYQQKIIKR